MMSLFMSFQSFLKDYHALFEQADTLVNSFSTWIVFCTIHEHYHCLSRRNNIRDQFRLQNNQNIVLQFFFKNFIVVIYVTILVIYFFMQQLSSFSLTKHFCEANLGLNKIFSSQFSVFVFVNLCKQTNNKNSYENCNTILSCANISCLLVALQKL